MHIQTPFYCTHPPNHDSTHLWTVTFVETFVSKSSYYTRCASVLHSIDILNCFPRTIHPNFKTKEVYFPVFLNLTTILSAVQEGKQITAFHSIGKKMLSQLEIC